MAKKRISHYVDPAVIEENTTGDLGRRIFATTLNQLMAEKGVDQDQMAADIGIGTGSVSNYRNGKSEPKLSALIKIADYLGVDCHFLMTGVRAEASIVSKDLGLSDESIGWIMAMNAEPDKEGLHVLDRMLSTEEFQFIISYVVYITKIFDEIKRGTLWNSLSPEEKKVISAAKKIYFEKDIYDVYSVELPEKAANAKNVLQGIFIDMIDNLFMSEKEWGIFPITTTTKKN